MAVKLKQFRLEPRTIGRGEVANFRGLPVMISKSAKAPARRDVIGEMARKKNKLNFAEDKFCELYATDEDLFGNGAAAYLRAYPNAKYKTALARVRLLLVKPKILARIEKYLQLSGLCNENVDRQLLFNISQFANLAVKQKAIEHFNNLRGRIVKKVESKHTHEISLTKMYEKASELNKEKGAKFVDGEVVVETEEDRKKYLLALESAEVPEKSK